MQLAVIGLYNVFFGHFQPSFNSIRHRFSKVSRKYLNGELYNNNEQLKAVNYCCKALHLRCLQVTSLRLWYICLFFYITLVFWEEFESWRIVLLNRFFRCNCEFLRTMFSFQSRHLCNIARDYPQKLFWVVIPYAWLWAVSAAGV